MKLVGLRTEANCYYGNHYDFYLCEIASDTLVYSVVIVFYESILDVT